LIIKAFFVYLPIIGQTHYQIARISVVFFTE